VFVTSENSASKPLAVLAALLSYGRLTRVFWRRVLDRAEILNALKAQRGKVEAAIAALETGGVRHGRRRRSAEYPVNGRTKRRRFSAAARKRISEAAKARWARVKRAGRNSL